MTNRQTFTAVRNGAVFLERGTLQELERLLKQGWCITSRSAFPDANGDTRVTLGLLLRQADSWPQLDGRDLNPELLGAAPARSGQDY